MRPTFVHCLFEQSGTFKNAFRQLGIPAWDYDIQDVFGQTNLQCDLFFAIDRAFNDLPSALDGISSDDLIMAFFSLYLFQRT